MSSQYYPLETATKNASVNQLRKSTLKSSESALEMFSGSMRHEWYEVRVDSFKWQNNYFSDAHSVLIFSADRE